MILQNITKAFGPRKILNDINYIFNEKEITALVGANGAGKTTLLNIICKIDEPDSGQVIIPKNKVLGYLTQEPNANPKSTVLEECMDGAYRVIDALNRKEHALQAMEKNYTEELYHQFEEAEQEYASLDGYSLEGRCQDILKGLGFKEAQLLDDPKSLSGGWRMRLELARVLVNDPDMLVLDEPTNHLDLPSLMWLEKFLQTFKGSLLFVSHDRFWLDRLPSVILHLTDGNMNAYKGNFSSFMEQYSLRQEQQEATYKNIQNKIDHLQKFVDKFGAKASKATQAQSKSKMIDKLRTLEGYSNYGDQNRSWQNEMELKFPVKQKSGRVVLTVENLDIGYNKPLSKNIKFKLERGQKVAFIGANGLGKSTLLKTIAGVIPALKGEITFGHNVDYSFFAQDQLGYLDGKLSALENVLNIVPDVTENQARGMLGHFLLSGDDVFKKLSILSGGEKSRVGLSCMMARKSNFLLLDEPTNHLDLSSIEALGGALEEFEGTVLFVSHDLHFIDSIATHILAISKDGRVGMFEGKIADYISIAKKSNFPNVLE